MRAKVTTLVLVFAFALRVSCFDSRNVVFIIVSQPEPYHASVASKLKDDIHNQILHLHNRSSNTHITHLDFPIPGAWTIVPLLRILVSQYKGTDVRWVTFLEPHTNVRCDKLIEALAGYENKGEVLWVGYPLSDVEPSIIHHFTMFDELEDEGGFVYPNFASGFAMRIELMEIVVNQLNSGADNLQELKTEFSIDPAFELAQLIYKTVPKPAKDGPKPAKDGPKTAKDGPLLTPDRSFCLVAGDNCATHPKQFDICGSPVAESSILFAVKTYSGFHPTRVKVVNRTWGKIVTHLVFYSDVTDPSIPTEDIGVRNTKEGHCVKTVEILKRAVMKARTQPEIQWIFLADDDTILGVQRLCEVLSCYRGGNNVTVLGERYGYGYLKKEIAGKGSGFDYITGGGGIVLSIGAAAILSSCACGSISAPDDMVLGTCAMRRNITLTHSPLFHQARPQEYPREVLARDRPVSFHKHLQPDPLKVYATWFQHDDLAIKQKRDEL